MTAIFNSLKNAWQTYTILTLMAAALVAFSSLPGRVSALESRLEATETVTRYMGCVLKAQAAGENSGPCNSHLSPDLIDYLRPR